VFVVFPTNVAEATFGVIRRPLREGFGNTQSKTGNDGEIQIYLTHFSQEVSHRMVQIKPNDHSRSKEAAFMIHDKSYQST
jgi:hypothetical protein